MAQKRDRFCPRFGSYASLLNAWEAGGLLPREIFVVPPFMEKSGIYASHPSDPEELPMKIGGGLEDTQQMIVVVPSGTPSANAVALQAAVDAAAELEPNGSALSATNMANVYVFPGLFDFGSGGNLLCENPYIRIIGMGQDPGAVWIKATRTTEGGTIRQTADYVRFYNMTWEIAGEAGSGDESAYYPDDDLPGTVLQDIDIVVAAGMLAMRPAPLEYSGVYRRVRSTSSLWRGRAGVAPLVLSGLFEECEGGDSSFGGHDSAAPSYSLITGTLRRCRAGAASFWSGADGSDATGLIEDCVAETRYSSGTWSSFNVKAATLRRVILTAQTSAGGDGIGAETTFVGRAEDCIVRITASSGNFTALRIGAGARVYGGTYIAKGSAKSIDAPSAVTAAIAHVRTNNGIGTNITNSIGTPYNVEDADLS